MGATIVYLGCIRNVALGRAPVTQIVGSTFYIPYSYSSIPGYISAPMSVCLHFRFEVDPCRGLNKIVEGPQTAFLASRVYVCELEN